jgi:hypothetical protein
VTVTVRDETLVKWKVAVTNDQDTMARIQAEGQRRKPDKREQAGDALLRGQR